MRKLSMSLRGTVLVASVSFIAFSFAVSQQAAQKKNQLSSVIDVILQTSDEKWKTLLDTVIRNCAKENANETTREAC
ncbi:MAG: hypothetical protein LBG52_07865 [Candidatus Peribacteria bacterium]|jgi:hypothetical protein|nr:hypothetical protein [Candidatus Peribacteria bacterium]